MLIIVSKYLIPKGFSGFTFFPFVFLKKKEDKMNRVLLNHERIHIRQQLELLILPFFVWYFLEYFFRLMQYRNSKKAYYNISFEREAYSNDSDSNYLSNRGLYSFFAYIKSEKSFF
jgi:hypothetical protein